MARLPLVEILALATAALILSVILFVPPPVGLADDGDFLKVTGAFGFGSASPGDTGCCWRDGGICCFRYITVKYRFDPAWQWWSGFPSSEMLLTYPALALNRLISKPGAFDLRAIGAVHAALFLLALMLYLSLLRAIPPVRRALLAGAAIFMFCDIMFVSYFNSFYMDTPALLFLLLTAAFFLRIVTAKHAHAADRAGFVISSLLLVTAKSQHSLIGLPIAALFFLQGRRRTAVVLAALSLFWILQVPFDYSSTARYNLIFYRIVPQASDRSRALRELGLDDAYTSQIGMHAYSENAGMGDQKWVSRFDARATYSRLLLYYLRHPGVPLGMLAAGLKDVAFQRVGLGNYPQSAGKPPAAQSHAFSSWSALKQALFASREWLYAIYCLALCALLPLEARGRRDLLAGALALVAITLIALGIGCLGDGLDYLRHLFLFTACVDMLALACLAALTIPHAPRNIPYAPRIGRL